MPMLGRMWSWRGAAATAGCALALLAQPVSASAQQARTSTPPVERNSARPPSPPPMFRNTRPLPELVADVRARQPYRDMDYIGVERYETRTSIYVLRFLNGRQVVVVHVDARTGRVLPVTQR